MTIPWSIPSFDEEEKNAAIKVIKSGWVTQGKVTEQFEKALQDYTGAKHAVVVNNGTAALIAAMLAHGIGPGDEVIVPSLTFIASINTIWTVGATPVLCDSDPQQWDTTPELMEEHITKKTKAIMPVDIAGMPINAQGFEELAEKHNLILVEDAASVIGGEFKEKKMGSFNHTSTFSFHMAKSLSTIEGGAVLTPDAEIAKKIKIIRNHGMSAAYNSKINLNYDYVDYGLNFRITDIQSAVGIEQLKKLDKTIGHRTRLVNMYKESFGDRFEYQYIPDYVTRHPNMFFGIKVKDNKRDEFARFLIKNGVDIRICWLPAHKQPYHSKIFKGLSLPGADDVGSRSIELPLGNNITEEHVKTVIEAVNKWKA